MRKVYLYGIASVEKSYNIVYYQWLEGEAISIRQLIGTAEWMRENNSAIEHVYAVDDRYGLYHEYRDAVQHKTIDRLVLFKTMLEKEGLMIL